MNNRVNSLGQPVGYQVPHWKAVSPPPKTPMAGHYCRIEPLDIDRHAADLFEAISDDADGRTWTYMAYGPFGTLPEYRAWMKTTCLGNETIPCSMPLSTPALTGRSGSPPTSASIPSSA
jgi:hypothetical protein